MVSYPGVCIFLIFLTNLCVYVSNHNNYTIGRWVNIPCIMSFRPFIWRGKNLREQNIKGYWVLKGLNPDWLTTASFGLPEWFLVVYRFLSMGYFAAALIVQATAGEGTPYEGLEHNDWAQYYTNQTFCLIIIYAAMGLGCHLWKFILKRKGKLPKPEPGCKYRPYNWLEVIFHMTFQTAATAGLMLTVFYWAVLYKGTAENHVHKHDNRMRHGFNVCIFGFDLLFSRTPMVTYHFHAVILWTTYYAIFMWCFWGAQHQWVYAVLDWNKKSAPTYYVAIPLLLCIAFFVWVAASMLRFVIDEAIEKKRGVAHPYDIVPSEGPVYKPEGQKSGYNTDVPVV